VISWGEGREGNERGEANSDRSSTYTIGSSLADEVVEENGRTYHVYKDGSEFSGEIVRGVC
jgi:hypothetical protein